MKNKLENSLIYIRINEAKIGEYILENFNMDINSDSVVGVVGSGSNEFIGIMLGNKSFNGDIVLDYVSLKGDIQDYREMISTITEMADINKTTLSVQEYIDFCSMYFNGRQAICSKEQINSLIRDFQLDKNTKVNQLSESELIKLNVLIGFLKQSKVVIIYDFFKNCKIDDKKIITNFIRKYANMGNVVLLTSKDKILIEEVCETIIKMPASKLNLYT